MRLEQIWAHSSGMLLAPLWVEPGGAMLKKLFLLILLIIFAACGDIQLQEPEEKTITSKGNETLCVQPPEGIEPKQKYLFVVDKSGSNVNPHGPNDSIPPTDPDGSRRINGIMDFYDQYSGAQNTFWGLITFQASYLVQSNALSLLSPDFQEPSINFVNETQTIANNNDGGTPYLAALNKAEQVIAQDLTNQVDDNSFYTVFFLSDGKPSDVNGGTVEGREELKNKVKDLIELRPGKVILNTAFYGPTSNTLALEEMAEAGNGKFVNFELSNDIDFSQFIVETTKDPWFIKELLIYNLNSSRCLDGSAGVDSDGDGLCDKDEDAFGLNKRKRFSFSQITNSLGDTIDASGYSDYFHWRRLQFGETYTSCGDQADEDKDFLTACEEDLVFNGNPDIAIGPQRNTADPLNPDTDFDGIIDGIEVRNSIETKGVALDSYNQQNPHISHVDFDREVDHVKEDGTFCYEIDVKKIPLHRTLAVTNDPNPKMKHAANENNILIYYLLAPASDPSRPRLMKQSIQKIEADERLIQSGADGTKISFEEALFETYEIPQE